MQILLQHSTPELHCEPGNAHVVKHVPPWHDIPGGQQVVPHGVEPVGHGTWH